MRKLVARDVARLYGAAGAGIGPEEVRVRRESLPEPARRYLDFALSPSLPHLRSVRLRHGGWFRTRPDAKWMSIAGEEHFTVGEPGFVWSARVRVAPLVWIEARDLLLGGRGNMLVKLFSRFTLADASGEHIDQGARLRWLAEAVRFPAAFAGPAVRWQAVDELRAKAVLGQDGLPVELLDGLVHVKGLPVAGPGSPSLGLGWWRHLPAELTLEAAMAAAGMVLYWRAAEGQTGARRAGMAIFTVLLAVLTIWGQAAATVAPPRTALVANWIAAPVVFAAIAGFLDLRPKEKGMGLNQPTGTAP
jgi:hypothetical protein